MAASMQTPLFSMLAFSFDASPYSITFWVSLSYLCFYTAYNKTTKKLGLEGALTILTCSKGKIVMLTELNKLISLAGLTVLLLAYLPQFASQKAGLLNQAWVLLLVHSFYSTIQFYLPLRRLINEKPLKQFSVVLGILSHLTVGAGIWGLWGPRSATIVATILGISHFYTMELDYKGRLAVRPFAYLPFAIAALVLLYAAFKPLQVASY